MEYQPILLQVSLEADLGSEPGYISVRGVHVVPAYCHPLPPKATKGVVLFSLGNVLTNPDIFEIAFFFFFFFFTRMGLLSTGNLWIRLPKPYPFETALQKVERARSKRILVSKYAVLYM